MRPRSSSVHCLHRSQHRSSKVCALLFLDSSSSSSRLQLQPRPRKTQSCLVNHHSLKTTKRSLHLFLRSLSPLLVYSSITGLRRSLAAIFRTPSPAGFAAHIYIPFIGTSLRSVYVSAFRSLVSHQGWTVDKRCSQCLCLLDYDSEYEETARREMQSSHHSH